LTGEVGLHGGCVVLEAVARWPVAGSDHCQDGLHEAAARGSPRAERQFSPDDCRTQRALAGAVGRLDSFPVQERSQPLAMFVRRLTDADQLGVAAEHTAQQEAVDLLSDRLHESVESAAGVGTLAAAGPVAEALLGGWHQVAAQPFHLVVCMIDQRLKVPLQMGPAPLRTAYVPVHPGSVAVDHAG